MNMKVYTASNLCQAELWRDLAREWPEVEFVARWPFKHVGTVPDRECYARVFWDHDFEDVSRADIVLVYAVPEKNLKGALVEAGMGIALGKSVIVVGEHESYSTWQYHRAVHRVPDLDSARLLLRMMEGS
jgi:nucleoside 2-deoxyribosyltransferase